jgi:hypothetical protein
MTEPRVTRDPASYRDPSGFVYLRDGVLLRQINAPFEADWHAFEASGLSAELRREGILVDHEGASLDDAAEPGAVAVIRPEPIGFLSFPYEWCFGQLKDAALLTLRAQEMAMERGMTLKDATAFNVQFSGARPILIDSLSFERYEEGETWIAYRQFCQHFLAPLAAMAYRAPEMGLLLRDLPDGMPVELASALLPIRTRLRGGLLSHIHLHASASRRAARGGSVTSGAPTRRVSRLQLRALLDSLRRTIEGLRWDPETPWSDYGRTTSYTEDAADAKRRIARDMLARTGGTWAWDVGANTGDFSELAATTGKRVVAIDSDPGAAEFHYRRIRATDNRAITSIVGDLTSPTPALGWDLRERPSLFDRANADVVLALAVVHHLAIGANVPLASVATTFARLAERSVVEFVDKGDPQVVEMLAHRRDIFADYSTDGFRRAFERTFTVEAMEPIPNAPGRTLWLLAAR